MEKQSDHFRHIMLYYFQKRKTATEAAQKICNIYGASAVTDRTVQKWYSRFRNDPTLVTATLNNIQENEIIYINSCEEVIIPDNTNEEIEVLENTYTYVNSEENAVHDNTNEESEVFKWPHEAILLLLEEYALRQNDFTSGKMSQKKIWALIAIELNNHNYHVTGGQCLSKFSGLKRTYKGVKDYNNKTGNRRTWQYFSHMDTLLNSKPFANPTCTLSSTGLKRSMSQAGYGRSSTESEKPVSKKIRPSDNLEKLIENLIEDRNKAEQARERRHRENMELRQKLLEAFNEIIDVLQK